jgi:hypothetical protein
MAVPEMSPDISGASQMAGKTARQLARSVRQAGSGAA